MKISARFPVTDYPLYLYLLIAFHFALLILSIKLIGLDNLGDFAFNNLFWLLCAMIISLSISFYVSFKHYRKITRAPDDLCWSGELWLMQHKHKYHITHYLKLQPDSWISQRLCLLHFIDGENDHYWLFSRSSLGLRLYKQLIRVVKMDIAQSTKQ